MSLFIKEVNNINDVKNLNFKLKRKAAITSIFHNDNVSQSLYEQSEAMYKFLESLSAIYKTKEDSDI